MKKLSEDHYIICDDSEITTGDIVAEKLLTGKYELFTIHTLNDIDKSTQKKITHSTQPLGFLNEVGLTTANLKPDWTNVEYLPLSEVKELLGVVDVEKKAHNWSTRQTTRSTDYWRSMVSTYVEAYNQALEDNKEKKYTEEDMRKAIEIAQTTSYVSTQLFSDQSSVKHNFSAEEIIQSLQPKTEWEVEFIDGKLKLKS